jgi:hypothetical protein
VVIHTLEEDFAVAIRDGGADYLRRTTGDTWQLGTRQLLQSNGRWSVDVDLSIRCIEDVDLHDLFSSIRNGSRGYFRVQNANSTSIIAPDKGLLMVGGYE